MKVRVVGAGVTGLLCALEFAERGARVELFERGALPAASACSWYAGGMLAPWCELERSAPLIARLGEQGVNWWCERFVALTRCNGTVVVAHPGDDDELTRFAQRSGQWKWIDGARLAELEPDLAGRFRRALFYPSEAHLQPRTVLAALLERLTGLGVTCHPHTDGRHDQRRCDLTLDCRGLAARDVLPDLRGVRGEMLVLRASDVSLSRPVRVLHPRMPLYVVPRGGGQYMLGATMVESEDTRGVTGRAVLELLGAACALHPAFADAELVETGTGLRPAFADNLPRIRRRGRVVHVNGLYRHGFLLAPALARLAADAVFHDRIDPEVMNENCRQRQHA